MEPAAAPPPPSRRKGVLVAGLAVLLALVGVAGWLMAGHGTSATPAQLAAEARVNVLALCDAVQSYRDEHGAYLTAGPVPREVPRNGKAVPFSSEPGVEAFQRIGFAPGETVHFQYEVTVQESPVGDPEVSCTARTDADGDGLNAVYRVRLDANGMTSPVEAKNEGE